MVGYIIKFFLMATIFGGILKAYFDFPFINENPKTSAAILILAVSFLIWAFPYLLRFFLKFLLFVLVIGVFCFLLWKVFGLTFGLLPEREETKSMPQQVETLQEKANHSAPLPGLSEEDARRAQEISQYANATDEISGKVTEVRSAYLIKVGPSYIKLYGIDGPDPAQTCKDRMGQNYPCGVMSKEAMERLVLNKVLFCSPVGGDNVGNFIATCRIDNVDIGAAIVYSGWAVADRSASKVYIPYEEDAHRKKQGLWEGKFIAPWDWRRMNNVIPSSNKQNTQKKKLFGLF